MVNNLIKFTVKNIDGCGNDYEKLYLVSTDFCLTNGHKQRLKNAVEEAKKMNEDCDVDEMMDAAMNQVFNEDECEGYDEIYPSIEIEL